MAKGISVSLDGFEELLRQIEKAEGSIDRAARKAVNAGADAAEQELRAEAAASGVPASVTRDITKRVEQTGNSYNVKVGWELGQYNPSNLSQGYKALFLNYGTPHRTKHGKIKAKGFIKRAKNKSRKKVKAAQQAALEEILGGLNK